MVQGLSVSRLVRASINLQPIAAARRSFGVALIVGDSNVINGVERIRNYVDIDGVAADFGTNTPEYQAALLYYGQSPKPLNLSIGRWLRTATSGFINGGILTASQQLLSNFTVITTGSFTISVNGTPQTPASLNFSGAANLNAVAALITTALSGAVCTWTGSRFVITSTTTGSASAVSYATTPGSGTDISTLLRLTAATALAPVPGFATESALEAVVALANYSADWYGLSFASSVMPDSSAAVSIGAFIEATTISRVYGVTETDTRVLDAGYTADLASLFMAAGYTRSFVQYSANPYADVSMLGRAFSVNFSASNSTITLMYKVEPSVVAENITESQAQALKAKRCNVFVTYQNNTAIIQYGVMSSGAYFDERHGLDWFQDALQNAEYNLLYQSATKIPQTDAGMNQLVNAAASVCNEAVNNGLVAPGVWNADGFGQLAQGQYLKSGYYIYAPPMALQAQAIREQRVAPPMQIALKLAGAIQELDIIINVNR